MQNLTPFRESGRSGWFIRWREPNGKRRRRKFTRKADAWTFARDIERQLQLGKSAHASSFEEIFSRYLAVYQGAASTKRGLRWKLDKALLAFGTLTPSALTSEEVESWRASLPEGHRYECAQALAQAIRWAGKAGLLEKNHPALDAKNPQPRRTEVKPFTLGEVERVADAIDPRWANLIRFAAATGLRPGELAVIQWSDVSFGPVPSITVCRRLTRDGSVVPETKNRTHRQVPLVPRAVKALRETPESIHTQRIFNAPDGGMLDFGSFRLRYFNPALVTAGFVDAEGKPDRSFYAATRHTFATRALRSGLSTFAVARRMGTSVAQIERTYGHLAPDALEHELAQLTAYDLAPKTDPKQEISDDQ